MTSTMKAVRIHEYGTADVLVYEDAPCPSISAGEVLVKVQAAGINPVDWKTRSGSGVAGRLSHHPFPLILGWDIAGVVEVVGSEVSRFKPGDEVFGMVRFPEIGSAYAQYVAAPQQHLALRPKNVDPIQAAAIPLAALTAWQGLFERAALSAGQRLLVTGAAGGVGHLAVQIAKWKGAHVIGTASTANIDFLHRLGVDEAIDYTMTHFENAVAPVDMVFDTVGGETLAHSLQIVNPGGYLVSIAGSPDQEAAAKRQVKATGFLVRPVAEHLAQIADLMASGHLKVEVSSVFPLEEVQKAHQLSEQRHLRGKIVLKMEP